MDEQEKLRQHIALLKAYPIQVILRVTVGEHLEVQLSPEFLAELQLTIIRELEERLAE